MSVLAAIAVLALLIVVHELGHFAAARLQGIYANRFSIGFGPVLWKYQGSQTEYAIRAFPLGGYVGFPDDDPAEYGIDPKDPNLMGNRPLLDRAIVISAGVIANLVFAYLVLVLMVGTVGVQQTSQPGVLVSGLLAEVQTVTPPADQAGIKPGDTFFLRQISADLEQKLEPQELLLLNNSKDFEIVYDPTTSSTELLTTTVGKPAKIAVGRTDENGKRLEKPLSMELLPKTNSSNKGATGIKLKPTAAIKAGIRPGDVVMSLNGQEFDRSVRNIQTFQKTTRESSTQPLQLKIRRGNELVSVVVTPDVRDGEGTIGVSLSPNGKLERRRVDALAIFSAGAEEFQNIVNDTIAGFGQLISRFSKVADQVAGPVAIVAAGARITQSDAANLFQFAALISINLAIINILPLPALDGGHLAFLLIEGLRGKPLPNQIQEGVMQTGLMLLLGLGIFLIFRDTVNLIGQ